MIKGCFIFLLLLIAGIAGTVFLFKDEIALAWNEVKTEVKEEIQETREELREDLREAKEEIKDKVN